MGHFVGKEEGFLHNPVISKGHGQTLSLSLRCCSSKLGCFFNKQAYFPGKVVIFSWESGSVYLGCASQFGFIVPKGPRPDSRLSLGLRNPKIRSWFPLQRLQHHSLMPGAPRGWEKPQVPQKLRETKASRALSTPALYKSVFSPAISIFSQFLFSILVDRQCRCAPNSTKNPKPSLVNVFPAQLWPGKAVTAPVDTNWGVNMDQESFDHGIMDQESF